MTDMESAYNLHLQEYAKEKILDWYKKALNIYIRFYREECCKNFDSCKWSRPIECRSVTSEWFDIKNYSSGFEPKELIETSSVTSIARYVFKSKKEEVDLIFLACYKERNVSVAGNKKQILVYIDNESDVDHFVNNFRIQESEYVEFCGFNPKPKFSDKKEIEMQRLSLYTSGKVFFSNKETCATVNRRTNNCVLDLIANPKDLLDYNKSSFSSWFMAIASKKFGLKFCAMCSHRVKAEGVYFCNLTGREVAYSLQPIACDNYQENFHLRRKYENDMESFKKQHLLDVYVEEMPK